jgi:glycosyltransferase involved in cell wall biosynthesis
VLLEAMAAGLAIITTSGTGCEEVVGDAAILVECRNSYQIRIAIERLLNDTELCKSLGKDARTRAITEFSWPTVASKYVECYERALGKVQV